MQERPTLETTAITDEAWPEPNVVLWAPCSRPQVEQWSREAEKDARIGLKAASCLVTLINGEADKTKRLEDARLGHKLALSASRAYPRSGLACYLTAYLAGLEAENNPLMGLKLVKEIEHNALLALERNPGVDHAGPARMLGELYLRAPGPPTSVGDMEKSIEYFRQAVDIDPNWAENRKGLIEALIEDEQTDEACSELTVLIENLNLCKPTEITPEEIAGLLKRLCPPRKP